MQLFRWLVLSRALSAALLLVAVMALPGGAAAQSTAAADAEQIASCVSTKAGPEGDLPPAGPLRDRFLKEMEGGPAACIKLVQNACDKAGGAVNACIARESRAWLRALALDKDTPATARSKAIWSAAASRIRAQAIALCEGAAALSAWGGETVKQKGKYGMDLGNGCVRDAIAQQAIILLVHVRGN